MLLSQLLRNGCSRPEVRRSSSHLTVRRALPLSTAYRLGHVLRAANALVDALVEDVLNVEHGNLEDEARAQYSQAFEGDLFVWRENWYPVANISHLKRERPNELLVLNEAIVIWLGEDQTWRAAVDRSADKAEADLNDRLAPLSEARTDNSLLESRFHGRQSESHDNNQHTAQTLPVMETGLEMYPLKEGQGLLWLWPQSGAAALEKSSRKQLPLYEDAAGPALLSTSPDYYYMLTPMDWFLAVENFLDPSHAPCLHEGETGNRKDMAHMDMQVTLTHPTQGIRVEHNGYRKTQQALQMSATREWIPPSTSRSNYLFPSGTMSGMVLYMTPAAPGSCHLFGKMFLSQHQQEQQSVWKDTSPKGKPADRWHQVMPRWRKKATDAVNSLLGLTMDVHMHTAFQDLTNQDVLVFSHSETFMKRSEVSKRSSECKNPSRLSAENYNLPTPADKDQFGGEPDWANGRPVKPAGIQDRKFLFDHYQRHTKHCPMCLRALDRLDASIKHLRRAMAVVIALALVSPHPLLSTALISAGGLMFWAEKWIMRKRIPFYGYTLLPDEPDSRQEREGHAVF